ncbi:MAG: TetR/AcrR family transcriptional regulator [Phenylobacterium sp.]|uniref:TetR/AcrR family transcriptional regulator n=1 Tax=Phenylobacterium sp. TaxID=1871053 RepID=UPI003918B6B0
MQFSYIQHLEDELRDRPAKQKGQRTRERLKIATAKMLEQRGYHAMRVTDVTECAGVAEGSFYVYFKDKTDASLTVLTGLIDHFMGLQASGERGATAFEAIRADNRKWLAVGRANAGLMRCIFQLADEVPEFADLSQRTNRSWFLRVTQSAMRRRPGDVDEAAVMLVVYMLGAMMDDLLRKLSVYPDREFLALIEALGLDDDMVADAASLAWLRVLYPDAPEPENLPGPIVALSRWLFGSAARPPATG